MPKRIIQKSNSVLAPACAGIPSPYPLNKQKGSSLMVQTATALKSSLKDFRSVNLVIPSEDTKRALEQRKRYVRDDTVGYFLPAREKLLIENMSLAATPLQQRILAFLRDHVHAGIPRAWYNLVLGHDLHVSTWATLHVKHFHALERNPFEPDQIGWLENVGLSSMGKVTVAFINFESLMLVTDATTIGDFKFHEVGLSAAAEANTDTALTTTTAIARATGTQLNPTAPTYQSVATVTADTTETWQEHGIFNAASGVTLLDRSLLSPTVAVNSPDTVQLTYTLTKNAEA
jgi:hypothetical protein